MMIRQNHNSLKEWAKLDAIHVANWDSLMLILGDRPVDWHCPELTVFLEYKPVYREVDPSLEWISMLQGLTIEKHADLDGKSFWWTSACYPLMPWLWTKPDNLGKQEYVKWNPVDPFFIDDSERRYRLIKASSRERETQRNVITQIFNPAFNTLPTLRLMA
ncbi:hypothetical protein AARAC_010555 [Aspergillus arachidicola]|uniref:Uncharacterized protein n=1 Tax=Aspergillus arachidicola TaxID=656916 RepID=A0A2G7FMJ4_9EURO|nr:hypothetical protein AARAC_010555 [Aspergillus arachidicola]